MNKNDYEDWYQSKFDDNAIAYAETHEEDFDNFCFERFAREGVDRDE